MATNRDGVENQLDPIFATARVWGWEVSDFCPERDTEPEDIDPNPDRWLHQWTFSKIHTCALVTITINFATEGTDPQTVCNAFLDAVKAYDPTAAAMSLVDANGHGKHGLPEDIGDLIRVMRHLKNDAYGLARAMQLEINHQEPAKRYYVSLVVDARFDCKVLATSPHQAYFIAKEHYDSVMGDCYGIEEVDIRLEHVEDNDGKYFYSDDLQ